MHHPPLPAAPISLPAPMLPAGSMLDNMMGFSQPVSQHRPTLPGAARGSTQTHIVRILLVESCDATRDALLSSLSQIKDSIEEFGLILPLEVSCATTGEEAWDLLSSRRFDIALVGISLPGISGLDLAWCYQQSVGSRTDALDLAPTVMVACVNDADKLPEKCTDKVLYEAGMQDLLTVPVTTPALRHTLHKWLPRRSRVGSELNLHHLSQPRGQLCSRVLHVESCAVTAAATACLLQELGMWIDTAKDGEAAMSLLSGGRNFDLVIVEVNLPGMSGYALCSWYKDLCRRQGKKPPPFVAVTAEPDVETCRSFDIDRCLPKPLTSQCAKRALQEWIMLTRMQQSRVEHPPLTMQPQSLEMQTYAFQPRPSLWQLLPAWSPQQSTQTPQASAPHTIQRRLSDEKQKATKLQKQAAGLWAR